MLVSAGFASAGGHSALVRAWHCRWSSQSTFDLGELWAECTYPLSRPKSISQPYRIFLQTHPLGSPALKRGRWLLPCPAQTEPGKRRERLCRSSGREEAFPGVPSGCFCTTSCSPLPCASAPSREVGAGGCKVNPQR